MLKFAKTSTLKKLIFIIFVGLSFSCSTQKTISESRLQNGDLIFVKAKQENLSGAINRVTQRSKTENFDHIGIIEISEDGIFVLHASSKLGSNRQPLNEFYEKNIESDQEMMVYRLKKAYRNSVESAIAKAKTLLGKPYNWSYVLNEESYYCSDFVERAFRENLIFEHIPMNFKNPKTNRIDDFWTDFYQKIEMEIPQDKPGTNPNQLASSKKLSRIGALKLGR